MIQQPQHGKSNDSTNCTTKPLLELASNSTDKSETDSSDKSLELINIKPVKIIRNNFARNKKHHSGKIEKQTKTKKKIRRSKMKDALDSNKVEKRYDGIMNDNTFYNGAIFGSFLGAAVSTLITKFVSNN